MIECKDCPIKMMKLTEDLSGLIVVNSEMNLFCLSYEENFENTKKKTAERIVLELKDKIDKNNVEFEATLLTSQPAVVSQDEAVDALVALGYSLQESKEAVQKCKKDGLNTEDIIKKSLSYLMSKSLR